MLSAVIPSERSQPAMLLARQLAHQRFVRPGPLVLGTALLKFPTPTTDRDRTVSRTLVPHYCGCRLYLHPLSRSRRVMGSIDFPVGTESHPLASPHERVVTVADTPIPRRCCSTSAAEIRFVFEWFRAAKASTSRAISRNSALPILGLILSRISSALRT